MKTETAELDTEELAALKAHYGAVMAWHREESERIESLFVREARRKAGAKEDRPKQVARLSPRPEPEAQIVTATFRAVLAADWPNAYGSEQQTLKTVLGPIKALGLVAPMISEELMTVGGNVPTPKRLALIAERIKAVRDAVLAIE